MALYIKNECRYSYPMGIPEDISEFEQSLNELQIRYEQYFLGLEKREPLKLLQTVERQARKYTGVQIVNTMLKFKYNTLVAKFNTYRQYWNRITRLIEEGKYSRDRFKMEMHQLQGSLPTEKPSTGKSVAEVDRLYNEFMEARKACNLDITNVSKEIIISAVEKQRPALQNKYGCTDIEFRVVVEDGKPKIKARPKKN